MTTTFPRLVSFLMAAVLAVAAIGKILAPARFATELGGLGLPWPPLTAALVIAAELVIAALLLFPSRMRAGLAVASLLFVIFAVILAVLMTHGGAGADCSCFGTFASRPIGWPAVIEDLVLALLATTALRLSLGHSRRSNA